MVNQVVVVEKTSTYDEYGNFLKNLQKKQSQSKTAKRANHLMTLIQRNEAILQDVPGSVQRAASNESTQPEEEGMFINRWGKTKFIMIQSPLTGQNIITDLEQVADKTPPTPQSGEKRPLATSISPTRSSKRNKPSASSPENTMKVNRSLNSYLSQVLTRSRSSQQDDTGTESATNTSPAAKGTKIVGNEEKTQAESEEASKSNSEQIKNTSPSKKDSILKESVQKSSNEDDDDEEVLKRKPKANKTTLPFSRRDRIRQGFEEDSDSDSTM